MSKLKPLEPPASSYHHGDLHRTLLLSAQAIIAETGRWDFSLREVARRAGVSHNAPYRHFADKEALLAAIGVAGYEMMSERGAIAIADLTRPAELLAALGKAYVDFGVTNAALYRLMFGQALPNVEGLTPELLDSIRVARNQLHAVILAGAKDGSFGIDPNAGVRVSAASVAAWSLVHGLTLLTIDRLVERDAGAEAIDDLSEQVVDLFVAGLRPRD